METINKIRKQILIDANIISQINKIDTDDMVLDIWADQECMIDDIDEFRCSGQSCGIPCQECSSNYESEQVARILDCGTAVSWIHWSGGGKHGAPREIDFLDYAFEVDYTTEEKVLTVTTFVLKKS